MGDLASDERRVSLITATAGAFQKPQYHNDPCMTDTRVHKIIKTNLSELNHHLGFIYR
jgi:hypothetical protein